MGKTAALTITVDEAAELLGVSRGSAYEAVRKGEIPTVRIGRRILVPKAKLYELTGVPAKSTVAEG